jgi:hypothetical protein
MSFPSLLQDQKIAFTDSSYLRSGTRSGEFDAEWLVENVRTATRDQVSQNAKFMLSIRYGESDFTELFPDLEHWMFIGLFNALGTEKLYSIAKIFYEDPWRFRRGWPDITMWKGNEVRFLEVKARGDTIQKSQLIINRHFIKPLSLNFALVDVQPCEISVATLGQPRLTKKYEPESSVDSPKPVAAKRQKPPASSIANNSYWCGAQHADTKQIRDIEEAMAEIMAELLSGVFEQSPAKRQKRDQIIKQYLADMAKAVRDSPSEGLTMALRWPPVPAFHEAMKATRTLLRKKLRSTDNYMEELFLLYALAALFSFTPHNSNRCQCAGGFISDTIPTSVWGDLKIDYNLIGYEKLELLTLSDIRLIVASWGEPSRHSTLNDFENHVWKTWEERYFRTKYRR